MPQPSQTGHAKPASKAVAPTTTQGRTRAPAPATPCAPTRPDASTLAAPDFPVTLEGKPAAGALLAGLRASLDLTQAELSQTLGYRILFGQERDAGA